MARNVNITIVSGNLVADPELRYIPDTEVPVCRYRVASNRKYGDKEETLFIDVTTFNKRAEIDAEHLRKGSHVLVEGRLKLNTWEKDGQKHSRHEIIAENVTFLGGKSEEEDPDE